MKPKEIVISVFCLIIIVGSIFTFLRMQNSSKPQTVQNTETKTVEFKGELDKYDKIMESVEGYTDYGIPALDNIGRDNPFAPIN